MVFCICIVHTSAAKAHNGIEKVSNSHFDHLTKSFSLTAHSQINMRQLNIAHKNSAFLGNFFALGSKKSLKGHSEFQKKNSRPLFTIIFKSNDGDFKTPEFSPLIERVLAGVDISQ